MVNSGFTWSMRRRPRHRTASSDSSPPIQGRRQSQSASGRPSPGSIPAVAVLGRRRSPSVRQRSGGFGSHISTIW